MITSMTGYGDAQGALDGAEFTVEIRCLNNRYYKPSIKLPEELASLESEIDPLLRKAVSRGTLIYTLRIKPPQDSPQIQINYPAVKTFLHELQQMQRDLGFEGLNIDMVGLLQIPGLTRPTEFAQMQPDRLKGFVADLTKQALDVLTRMRRREGQALCEDFIRQVQTIRTGLNKISQAAPEVVRSYQAKLCQRISELLSGANVTLSQDDLAREVAIFAERCDISEEIVRLRSHLDSFEEICQGDAQSGRRLDFIAQEMLREANTIGAKALDAAIGQTVVDIKTAIDRIKEQAQNVE